MASNDFDQMMADDQAQASQTPPLAAPDVPVITAPESQPVPVNVALPPISQLEGGDFDEMMKADKDLEFAQAKVNFMASEGQEPERAAQVYNLATKIGTDPSFVDRNYDTLKSGIDVNQIDFGKLSRLHPSIAKLANDPVKAAAIRDQVTTLSKFDNAVKDHTLFEDAYNLVGYSMAKLGGQVAKIPALMYDTMYYPANALRKMRGDPTRIRSEDTFLGNQNPLTQALDQSAEGFRAKVPILNEDTLGAFMKTVHSSANASFPERMMDALAQGDYAHGGKVLFAQTAAFLPTLGAIMGASIVNPLFGPAAFGATSAAEHNAEYQKEGKDPAVGTPTALVHGAIAGYFTTFGVNAYLGTVTKRLSGEFGVEVTRQVMKSYGSALITAAGAEAGTMAGMSLADDFADYATGINPNALEGAAERAVNAGLMGALMGAGTHGGGEAIVKAHEYRRALAVRDFVSDLVEKSKNKVRERSPDLNSEFMGDSLSGSSAEFVQISPDAAERYFQSKGVDPVKAMSDLGFLDQFGHAKETGTNIKVKTKDFIDAVVKNNFEDLTNDIKIHEEDKSVNEINAEHAVAQAFENVDNEGIRGERPVAQPEGDGQPLDRRGLTPDQNFEEQAERLRKMFTTQLVDAGRDPKEAVILSKFFQTVSQREGISPNELYKRYPIRITSEGVEGLPGEGQTFNQDGVNDGFKQTVPGAEGREAGVGQGDGGGSGPLPQTVRGSTEKLSGLPASSPGGVTGIRDLARQYVESRGGEYKPQSRYVTVDRERAARIAQAYEEMEHRPNDPEVKAAYDAMISETAQQYQLIKESGLVIEAIKPGQENPYPNGSADMLKDVEAGHLWFFPTDQGFGADGSNASGNPLLQETGEVLADGTPLKANDVFRIVHDYFGHAKEGVAFGANGEENAWASHVRMYSPLAARAMTTETRGQNSWVNFGPHGEANRTNPANTRYADQKTGLLPEWASEEGRADDIDGETYYQGTNVVKPQVDPLGFFSQVDAELGKMDFKAMPAKDLLNRIKNIQGIKKEELEALGLEDYLNLRAEEAGKEVHRVTVTHPDEGTSVRKKVFQTREAAEAEAGYFRDAPGAGITAEVTTEKMSGKVSKEEILDFVRNNGLKIEQVVLSEDYVNVQKERDRLMYERDQSRSRDRATNVDDVQWREPERDYAADDSNIENEYDYFRNNVEDDYWDDEKKSFYEENSEEYTEEDGTVDDEALEKAWQKKLDELALERAQESVNDPDYPSATFIVHERASGTSIYGSDDIGWVDNEGNDLGYNLNEAQIKHVQKLLERGDLEYPDDPDTEDQQDEDTTLPEIPTPDSMRGLNPATGKNRFTRFTVDGGTNKREVLLKMPGNTFEYSAHYPGQEGILAHIRISDRVDASGKKTLFLEEVQSDLHQQGREKGYKSADADAQLEQLRVERKERVTKFNDLRDEFIKQREANRTEVDEPEFNHTISSYEEDVGAEAYKLVPEEMKVLEREYKENWAKEQELQGSIPDAPFKATDAWASLALKRMLRMAVEEGYDAIAWAPADVHIKRWGTDEVTWVKAPERFRLEFVDPEVQAHAERVDRGDGNSVPSMVFTDRAKLDEFMSHGARKESLRIITEPAGFLVGAIEQRGGQDGEGNNLEDLARNRGQLLEKDGERITTKEELAKIINSTLDRERSEASLNALTERVWKQMQSGEASGQLLPREEGMKFFYDKVIPDTMKKILKKIDPAAKMEVGEIKLDTDFGNNRNYHVRNTITANGEYNWRVVDRNEQTVSEHGEDGDAASQERDRLLKSDPPVQKHLTVELTEKLKKVVGEDGFSLFQKENGEARGQIFFGKDGSIELKLLAKANRSTFFHEVGHFFLHVMKDLSAGEEASGQLKDDFEKMMTFLDNKGEKFTVDQHEKAARAFEEYIMEGKAPSKELESAFSRFRTWMVDIYKMLRNNDVELTDDVRGVFDRLLATDAEIEHAETIQNIKPLFEEGTLPKGVHERYQRAFESARRAADDQLRARVMEDIQKRERKLYKEQLAESVTRVTEQVKTMPVYQALSALQRGQSLDDKPLPEGLKDLKINREALVKEFGKDVIKKLPKVHSKDGLHPDIVADYLGYESGKAMIEDFTKYPKMKDYIDNQVEADMQLKSPDLFKSERMPDEALAAIHNDERARVLRMELDILRDQNPGVVRDLTERVMKRPLPARQMTEQMEGVIGKQTFTDVSPNKYRIAERQAGREAAKAFANGDMTAAFEAKTRELKNYHLFKAATEAKAEMEKSLKFFKKLGASDEKLSKTRDINLVNTARAVLAAYGIGKSDLAPREYLKKMEAYDPQAFEAATYHVHAATEGGNARNYKELSYGQFRAMSDSVKALYELAKSSKEVEIGGKKLSRDLVVTELIDQLSGHGDIGAARPGMKQAITLREKTKMNLMGAKAALRRVEHWSHAIDGDDYGGVTVKTLVEPIKQAETKMHTKKVEVMQHYRDKVVLPSKDVFEKRDIEAPEIDYTFGSKSELLGALIHTGNQSNFSKLLRGRGWGDIGGDGVVDRTRFDQMVDRLQKDGTLTKADYDYLQGVWDMYEGLKPDAQRAHFAMYGFHFNEITADTFQTPFGEYKGGYAPAVADPNISEDAALRREKDSFGNKMDMTLMPTGGRGFTKSRIEAYAAPLAMDLKYVPMQIDKMLRFTYMEPVVRDLSKIVLDRKYSNALGAVDSAARSEMLIPYLQRAATQATTTPSGTGKGYQMMDNVFRKMRGSTGLNAMTLNVVNAFHQLTGFSVAAALVEPRYLRDATIRYTRRASDVTHAMHEKSEYMRAKESGIGELQTDIENLMNDPGGASKVSQWIGKNSYVLQKFSAGMTEAVAWTAAYDKAVAEGKTENEAVLFGDSVVRRTQHSASPTDVSRFGTGTPLQRLFTMYFDYFNNKANLNLTQAGNLSREFGMKKGMLHMAPLYIATMMIPAIMTKLAYKGAGGKFDEHDDGSYMDDVLHLFFHSQLDEGLTSVPMLGPITTAAINTFNDNPSDDRMSLSPAIELAMRTINMPRHISDFAHGRGKPSKAIKDVFSIMGMVSGLPIQPLAKPIGYAADVAAGKVRSSGPVDYTRGLITGQGPRR